MGELISVSDAAEELGVSRVTVHNLIEAGRIEAHTLRATGKPGRKGVKRWLLLSDVQRLKQQQRKEAR